MAADDIVDMFSNRHVPVSDSNIAYASIEAGPAREQGVE